MSEVESGPPAGVDAPRPSLLSREVVLVCSVCFIAWVGFAGIIPVIPLWAVQRGGSVGLVSAMVIGFLAANAVLQAPLGHLSDRTSRRRVIIGGLVVYAAAAVAFVFVTDVRLFVVLRILEGAGTAAVMPAARALLADAAPPGAMGRAYGLAHSVQAAGLALGPFLGGWVGHLWGPTAPFWMCAGLLMVAVAAGVALPVRAHRVGSDDEVRPSLAEAWREVGALTGLRIALLANVGWMVAQGLYEVVWSIYLKGLGADLALIGLTFTLYGTPVVLFSYLGGRLADRVGTWPMVMAGAVLSTCAFVAYATFRDPRLIVAFVLLEGFGEAASGPALLGYLARVGSEERRGAVLGAFGAGNMAVSILAAAAVVPVFARWPRAPFLVAAAVLMLSVPLAWVSDARRRVS